MITSEQLDESKKLARVANDMKLMNIQLALKERICKNCKWWKRDGKFSWGGCNCWVVNSFMEGGIIVPAESFGCNQWEVKDDTD